MNEQSAAQPAQFTSPEARINALVQAMTDALLNEATRDELVVLKANPAGIVSRLQSDLRIFAGNLVSASSTEQPPQPQPFHSALGIPQREPPAQAIDVAGLMRTLGADATEH